MYQSLVVHILFDPVAHSIVVEKHFALLLGYLFLIFLYHSLIEPVNFGQNVISHRLLILNHLLLLHFVHYSHLKLLIEGPHAYLSLPLVHLFDVFSLGFYFLIEIIIVLFPLLALGGERFQLIFVHLRGRELGAVQLGPLFYWRTFEG